MKPLRTVAKRSFKALITGLCPAASIMCRQTLHDRSITHTFSVMKENIQNELQKASYVCTTADLWSSSNRSFLGVTAHWYNEETLSRKSAALACVRFKGKHSFDKIAAALSQTHANYNIEMKVVMTCTDNGSNMVKAFSEFSVKRQEPEVSVEEAVSEAESDSDSAEEGDEDNDLARVIFDSGVSEAIEASEDNVEVTLPEHMRCCSHTLNLVATKDAEKALGNAAYKKLYRQAMAKSSALWNLTSRSTKAADTTSDILGFRLSVPCVTRWNSYYEAVKKIIAANSKLAELCTALGLPLFLQTDVSFLKEYLSVMAPVATSLDILEGEQQCALGFVLPMLAILKKRLVALQVTSAEPLRASILEGIENCFGQYFQHKEFMLAAISHPKFRLAWIDDAAERAVSTQMLEQAVRNNMAAVTDTQCASTAVTVPTNSSADEFFSFSAETSEEVQHHLEFLNDKDKDILMMNRHPEIKKIFLRYNTTLPSSAPVERLFSTAALVLTKHRNKLKDSTFENLSLMKINKHY